MDKRRKSMGRMNSFVAGIDLGEEESYATYMAPDGYRTFREKVPEETRIVFEASGSAYSVSKALINIGYRDITVSHPKELSYITKSKNKNDRVDSLKLAELHLVGMIPESHLHDPEDRIFRDLLIQRVKLGRSIASTKNSIIGYLKREDIFQNHPESSENFSGKRRKAMEEIRFGDQRDLVLSTLMERLEFFERQIIPLDSEIRRIAEDSGDVRLLMSIPGDRLLPCLAHIIVHRRYQQVRERRQTCIILRQHTEHKGFLIHQKKRPHVKGRRTDSKVGTVRCR